MENNISSMFLTIFFGILWIVIVVGVLHIYWQSLKLIYKHLGGGAAFVVGLLLFVSCSGLKQNQQNTPNLITNGLDKSPNVQVWTRLSVPVTSNTLAALNVDVMVVKNPKTGKKAPSDASITATGLTLANVWKVVNIDFEPTKKVNTYKMHVAYQKDYSLPFFAYSSDLVYKTIEVEF
jgi:hypothetical protein